MSDMVKLSPAEYREHVAKTRPWAQTPEGKEYFDRLQKWEEEQGVSTWVPREELK